MNLKVSVPVSVVFAYQADKSSIKPLFVNWNGRNYRIIKTGLHHTYRQGRTLYHVFSVVSQTLFFRLILNTENLFWRLEEISDGQTS